MNDAVSMEAMIEADDIAYSFHLCSPESNEAVYVQLVERRAGLLAHWTEARAAGDWNMAERIILDVLDANYVTAAAREAIEYQRRIVRRGPYPDRACHAFAFDAEPG